MIKEDEEKEEEKRQKNERKFYLRKNFSNHDNHLKKALNSNREKEEKKFQLPVK